MPLRRNRRQYEQLTDFDRGRIIGLREAGAIYQQDNARPHTARLSQQCLQGYDVLPWPRQVTRSFANRACLTRWEGNCSRPEIQEN
ncbi:hypothetical protein TNCV_2033801 [Trichonephila clavipes]|nr:hypothetical protein TNCV_2033801 [Trichonephila clavipes]